MIPSREGQPAGERERELGKMRLGGEMKTLPMRLGFKRKIK
jgi:hypothetical protein